MRYEPGAADRRTRKSLAIDVVHIDFLVTFIDSHVLPFAMTFAERIARARAVVAKGVVYVDRHDWSWRDLPEGQGV